MRPFLPKAGWMLAGVLALYVLSALTGVVSGGDLNPPGLPGSTMKSLADVPPSWHRTLLANNGDVNGCNSTRFTCVLDGAALLDNETGLVWERDPDTTYLQQRWVDAFYDCAGRVVGGREGWRLPSMQEATSLRDGSVDHTPDGAPFPSGEYFWTSTLDYGNPEYVLLFKVNESGFTGSPKDDAPSVGYSVWCVRGPQPASHTGGPP